MKTSKVFFILLIVCINVNISFSANNIPDKISIAFKNGNALLLSEYFNENIEITLLETEGIYSKTQAEQMIIKFFKDNLPENFNIIHKGGKETSNFAICEYITKNNKYRITIYLKDVEGQSLIHQLRIQYDNN